jgi:hypothetical protein
LPQSEPDRRRWAERLPAVPLGRQVLVMTLALVVPTLVAKLFGAGWGTAAAFGQMGFVAAVTWAIFTGERRSPPPGPAPR